MPDMKDDGGGNERQPRDQWGGLLQNEYGRAMGRMEGTQAQILSEIRELKDEGKHRDKSLNDINERVRANAHKANNDLQTLSNRVQGLDGKLVNVGVAVDTANKRMEQQAVQLEGINTRVGKLEEPIQEGMVLREKRRAKLKRWWMWMAAVGVFLWGGFEPIYKTLMPVAIQRWFNINLPPH